MGTAVARQSAVYGWVISGGGFGVGLTEVSVDRSQMELLHDERRLPSDVKLLDVAYIVNWDRVRIY